MAPQLMVIISLWWRGLYSCTAFATSSLPVPLSPAMRTGASDRATRPTILKTPCSAREMPIIFTRPSFFGSSAAGLPALRRSSRICRADSTTVRSSKASDSLRSTSWAPRWVASMIWPVLGKPAVRIIIVFGLCWRMRPSSSMPSKGSSSIAATTTPTGVFSTTFNALAALSQRRILRFFANKCFVAQSRKSRSGSTRSRVSSWAVSDISGLEAVLHQAHDCTTKKVPLDERGA